MSPLVTAALASTKSILVDVVWQEGNITIEQISTNTTPVTSEKWACDTNKTRAQFWKPVINLDKVRVDRFTSIRGLGIQENVLDLG
ncbi:MAG: hypothetical protein ASARMPRED_005700 [Alectoria sarmentosa]|nr:MAG: hypothetical protein ASARMPRED_005700 [Alectoria sarmentosa]